MRFECERCGEETTISGSTHHAPVCADCGGVLVPVVDVEQVMRVLAESMGTPLRHCPACGAPFADRDAAATRCPGCRGTR